MKTVAALYVAPGGCYYGLPGVEPWGLPERDAREYRGPHPVVAHPPCARWCQLAHVNQARYGLKVGDDGGCFESALAAVREWGGVLEHPALSYAWAAFNLAKPERGRWKRSAESEWVTEVSQVAYGHRARKRTWLLFCGGSQPPALDWSEPEAAAQVSFGKKPGGGYWREPMSKAEAKATPLSFRDLLLEITREEP